MLVTGYDKYAQTDYKRAEGEIIVGCLLSNVVGVLSFSIYLSRAEALGVFVCASEYLSLIGALDEGSPVTHGAIPSLTRCGIRTV